MAYAPIQGIALMMLFHSYGPSLAFLSKLHLTFIYCIWYNYSS